MPEEEAVRLAGFDRYTCSIMVLTAGLLFMQATIDMEHSFAVQIRDKGAYRIFRANIRSRCPAELKNWSVTGGRKKIPENIL